MITHPYLLCIAITVFKSARASNTQYTYLSIRPFVLLSVCLSICPFVCCLSVNMSFVCYLTVCLSICLAVCLSVVRLLSNCLSVCLSYCLSIRPSSVVSLSSLKARKRGGVNLRFSKMKKIAKI